MNPLHIQTPLLLHRGLSAQLNKRVLLKMESSQPSGSFKLRGIGLMCQRAVTNGARHFICPSGGNAGFSLSHLVCNLSAIAVPHGDGTCDFL